MKTLSSIAAALLASGLCVLAQGAYTYADVTFLSRLGATSSATNLTSGLIGWWKMDDGSGNSAFDSSGNGFTASVIDAGPINWKTGKIGGAVQFGGAGNQGFNAGTHAALTTAPFTYSAWVYPTNFASYWSIIGSGGTGGEAQLSLYQTTGQFYLGNYYGAVGVSDGVLTANAWNWIAVSYDGTHIAFYTNGVAAGVPPNNTTAFTANEFHIGSTISTAYTLPGMIDDLRVYNRVLSAADITYLYHQWYGQP